MERGVSANVVAKGKQLEVRKATETDRYDKKMKKIVMKKIVNTSLW